MELKSIAQQVLDSTQNSTTPLWPLHQTIVCRPCSLQSRVSQHRHQDIAWWAQVSTLHLHTHYASVSAALGHKKAMALTSLLRRTLSVGLGGWHALVCRAQSPRASATHLRTIAYTQHRTALGQKCLCSIRRAHTLSVTAINNTSGLELGLGTYCCERDGK
jgi:hypothetical protein